MDAPFKDRFSLRKKPLVFEENLRWGLVVDMIYGYPLAVICNVFFDFELQLVVTEFAISSRKKHAIGFIQKFH